MSKKHSARPLKKSPPKAEKDSRRRRVQPLSKPNAAIMAAYPVLSAFFDYDWGVIPLRHAFGAYALCLYANRPDYTEVATAALTEGGDDKDCDFCLVDTESGDAFIVQATASDVWGKGTASSNKADDLLTAVSWLFKQPYDRIPASIRPKAIDLQEAITRKSISEVHLLYVHNSLESKSVKESLHNVAAASKTLIGDSDIKVVASEIGLSQLQHLYNSLTKQIVVEDKVVFNVDGILEETSHSWSAIQTTISGDILHDLWQAHQNDLFSANIRGFLDLGRRTSVNRGILDTVSSTPTDFWAFNNGVTILTRAMVLAKNGKSITATGVSVINGAQTTGVLGEAPREKAALCRVPCRFIKCSKPDLVNEIIENNNTQNAIKAFDIRSNDKVQRRLQTEFTSVGIDYLHRRQGAQRLGKSAIQAEVLAPSLAAFHGRFQVAIRQRKAIFEDRSTYGEVFPHQVTAAHALLVQTLAVAIDRYKVDLMVKEKADGLDEADSALHEFLQYSTAKLFAIGVFGRLASQIVGESLPDVFAWKVSTAFFKPNWQSTLVPRWLTLVEAFAPLIVSAIEMKQGEAVRSSQELERVAKRVGFQIKSLQKQYNSVLAAIQDASVV